MMGRSCEVTIWSGCWISAAVRHQHFKYSLLIPPNPGDCITSRKNGPADSALRGLYGLAVPLAIDRLANDVTLLNNTRIQVAIKVGQRLAANAQVDR